MLTSIRNCKAGQEDLVNSTVNRIEDRRETLGSTAYPFNLDARW